MEDPDDFSGQFPRINEYVRPSVKGRMMKIPLEILATSLKISKHIKNIPKKVSLKYYLCWLFYCLDLNFLAGIAAKRPKLNAGMPDNNTGFSYTGCLEIIAIYKTSESINFLITAHLLYPISRLLILNFDHKLIWDHRPGISSM